MTGPSGAEGHGEQGEMGRNQYSDLPAGDEHERPELAADDDGSPRTGQEWAAKWGYVDRVNIPSAFDTDRPITKAEFAQLAGGITMRADNDPATLLGSNTRSGR